MSEPSGSSLFALRQARLSASMVGAGLNAIALNPGPSLVYLTGLHFHLSERPVVALFVPNMPPYLILPELEAAKSKGLAFPTQVFMYSEDPTAWPMVFRQAVMAARIDERKIGLEPTRFRYLELSLLQAAAKAAEFISAEEPLSTLRMRKDEEEIDAMRQAAEIAQRAMIETLPMIRAGVTEREVASELSLNILRAGSDPELPFSPIVSGGPNSANPHASPSDRSLQEGDLLVIDWGASYKGYFSDITRTYAIGWIEDELAHISKVVNDSNAAGRAAVKPGVPASQVDHSAREVIIAAGYGEYFIHRTGHGLGLEAHEAPYIRADNPLLLDPGMTFTVEPGIYLPSRGGVRVEDDIVVTHDGSESLTTLSRQIQTLPLF